MKKVLMVLLSVALVFSLVGVGAAAQQIVPNPATPANPAEGEVTVTLTVSESYVVNIPDTVTLNRGNDVTDYVGLDMSKDHLFAANQHLNIYVASQNSWNVTYVQQVGESESVNPISYQVTVSAAGFDELVNHLAAENINVADLTGRFSSPTKYVLHQNVGTNQVLVYSALVGNIRNPSPFIFKVTGDVSHSGTYQDTLTFTVMLQNDGATKEGLETVLPYIQSTHSA